jgi:hypothetical protein
MNNGVKPYEVVLFSGRQRAYEGSAGPLVGASAHDAAPSLITRTYVRGGGELGGGKRGQRVQPFVADRR